MRFTRMLLVCSLLLTSAALANAASTVVYTASSTGVSFCINDYSVPSVGFSVKPIGFSTPNAQSAIVNGKFHLQAASPAGDSGIVLFFDGSMTLGNLNSIVVNSSGGTLSVNLWLDKDGDGKFFVFDANGMLTSTGGDAYGGSAPASPLSINNNTSFTPLNGAFGTAHTLAQLKSGTVSGFGPNTRVAIWIGQNANLTADISSVTVNTVASYVVTPATLVNPVATNPFTYDTDSAPPTAATGAPAGFGAGSFFASVLNSGTQPAPTTAQKYRTFRIMTNTLFGHTMKVSDIASITYQTNKPADQTGIDWRLTMYTGVSGTSGNDASWYRSRIQGTPYNSLGLNAPANQWNTWSTNAGANQLLFTDTIRNGGGQNETATWSQMTSGPVTLYRGAVWDFSGEQVLWLDVTLGANSGGGTGSSQLDAIKIVLADGEEADLDLEADPTNTLTLDVAPTTLFVRSGKPVVVALDVWNLAQVVDGGQFFLSYNSNLLSLTNVVAGGGVWDDLVATQSFTGGLFDTSVGVYGLITDQHPSPGTQADGTVAFVTLTAGAGDGTTQILFQPTPSSDPNLVATTMLSDMHGYPVFPNMVNSVNIVVDNTPPTLGITSATEGDGNLLPTSYANATADGGVVTITVSDVDNLSGFSARPTLTVTKGSSSLPVTNGSEPATAGVFTYTVTIVAGTANGAWTVTANVSDQSGNAATPATATLNIDTIAPTVTITNAAQNGTVLSFNVDATDATSGVNGQPTVTVTTATRTNVAATSAGGDNYTFTLNDNDGTLVTINATATDNAGNQGSASTQVTVNVTGPSVGVAASQVQNGSPVSLTGSGAPAAIQTASAPLTVTVTAQDNDGGLTSVVPVVGVVDSAGHSLTVTGGTAAGANGGTYTYSVTINSLTANGTATINVSVTDNFGNTVTNNATTFAVNKNQITGQVQSQGFVGTGSSFNHALPVTFVITAGGVQTTVTQTLANASGDTFNYTLTNMPNGVTAVSAKTAWTLRSRLAASLDANGQATVNFTGSDELLGGDLNGSNSVNILDYTMLKTNWFTNNPIAEICGVDPSGNADYTIMLLNWFKVGAAE